MRSQLQPIKRVENFSKTFKYNHWNNYFNLAKHIKP
jgi:hypothetical protein